MVYYGILLWYIIVNYSISKYIMVYYGILLWYITMVYYYGILTWDYTRLYRDDYRVYWGYIGMMEKKMETTIL